MKKAQTRGSFASLYITFGALEMRRLDSVI